MSAFFDFKVHPLPEPLELRENEQPYTWRGFCGATGRLHELTLEFGVPRVSSQNKALGFYLSRYYAVDGRIKWRFAETKIVDPPTFATYPREKVEGALRGHTDPILSSALVADLEAWCLELWDSGTVFAQRKISHGELNHWLSFHNGKVSLRQPQIRLESRWQSTKESPA